MITIQTSGIPKIEVEHVVLDYDGTLAIDGKLIISVKSMLKLLSEKVNIHILTADTFGNAKEELEGIDCSFHYVNSPKQDLYKEDYVNHLEREKVVAIGNGTNDASMFRAAALGIAVIQKEGTSIKAILESDIVCCSIEDALELLLNPLRIIATLKNKS